MKNCLLCNKELVCGFTSFPLNIFHCNNYKCNMNNSWHNTRCVITMRNDTLEKLSIIYKYEEKEYHILYDPPSTLIKEYNISVSNDDYIYKTDKIPTDKLSSNLDKLIEKYNSLKIFI